jgi:hypothetical protein
MQAAVAFALLASASAVAPLNRATGDVIPNQYFVKFHKTSTQAQRDAHMGTIKVCASGMGVLASFPARLHTTLPDGFFPC